MGACMALAVLCFRTTDIAGKNLWLRGAVCVLTTGLFVVLHRDDLREFWLRAKNFRSRPATT
jgi:hypothetical protein